MARLSRWKHSKVKTIRTDKGYELSLTVRSWYIKYLYIKCVIKALSRVRIKIGGNNAST